MKHMKHMKHMKPPQKYDLYFTADYERKQMKPTTKFAKYKTVCNEYEELINGENLDLSKCHNAPGLVLEGDASGLSGRPYHLWGDCTNIQGYVSDDLYGCVSNISGDISNIEGTVAEDDCERGDLVGDVSGLAGFIGSVTGDATGHTIDFDEELSDQLGKLKGDFYDELTFTLYNDEWNGEKELYGDTSGLVEFEGRVTGDATGYCINFKEELSPALFKKLIEGKIEISLG